MNKLRLLYAVVICAIVFIGCKKNKEEPKKEEPVNNPSTKTPQQILSAALWKITALTSSVAGDVWNNAAFVKPCNKDNTYYFKKSNILTAYDTPVKCNPTDPDSTSGPYLLFDNNKKIYLELLIGSIQIKDTTDVKYLDSTTMILNFDYSGFPGEITFKH